MREETIERIMSYVEKLPDVDPELVRKTLTIFFLHREVEILAESYSSRKYELSMRQFETLEVLYHKQDMDHTPAQLAEEINLTRSAMTGNLDSLEKKGYISRVTHPNDRRKLVITLTLKGRKHCEKIMAEKYRDLSRVMEDLSSEMADMLKDFNERLIINIKRMLMEVIN